MRVATVNKVRRTRNSEKEVGVLQYLAILEYIGVNNAKARISENGISQCSGALRIANCRYERNHRRV